MGIKEGIWGHEDTLEFIILCFGNPEGPPDATVATVLENSKRTE